MVKGRSLLDTVTSIRSAFGDAGLRKVLSSVEPPFRALLAGDVLVSDWYPLDAMTCALERNLELNDPDEAHAIQRAEQAFDRQLNGVYKIFVRLGSPEWIIKRIGAVHETYFRNVQIAASFGGERRAVVRYVGFQRQHRVIELLILGFYRKALELSGAKERGVRITTSIAADKGYLELALSW